MYLRLTQVHGCPTHGSNSGACCHTDGHESDTMQPVVCPQIPVRAPVNCPLHPSTNPNPAPPAYELFNSGLGQLVRRHRADDTVTKAVNKVLKARPDRR
jgi:hypothetical protein